MGARSPGACGHEPGLEGPVRAKSQQALSRWGTQTLVWEPFGETGMNLAAGSLGGQGGGKMALPPPTHSQGAIRVGRSTCWRAWEHLFLQVWGVIQVGGTCEQRQAGSGVLKLVGRAQAPNPVSPAPTAP